MQPGAEGRRPGWVLGEGGIVRRAGLGRTEVILASTGDRPLDLGRAVSRMRVALGLPVAGTTVLAQPEHALIRLDGRGHLPRAYPLAMAKKKWRYGTGEERGRLSPGPRALDLPGPSRRIRVEPIRLPEPARRPTKDPCQPVKQPERIPEPGKPEREPTPA